jgi:cobalamin biosynthetic protein CobC
MLEHGGNLNLASKQHGIALENWLDLSTGINPNGYPISAIAPTVWQRLPLDDDGLTEVACTYYGCQNALPVAGSQAAIQALPTLRPSCKVAMPEFMYQEHAQAWRKHGHTLQLFNRLTDDIVNQADVVLLCNPNNPTAQIVSPADLLQLHAKLTSKGGWLIVDEAFMDATPENSIAQYSHLPGLIVLRSIGKFFGLGGARAGFVLAHQQLLKRMQEALGPWGVAGPSRIITKQALSDFSWQRSTQLTLRQSSQRLAKLLHRYGLTPQAGTDLFQFVPTPLATQWQQHLASQGVWVRYFDTMSALRFGLPTENGWLKLEQALALKR